MVASSALRSRCCRRKSWSATANEPARPTSSANRLQVHAGRPSGIGLGGTAGGIDGDDIGNPSESVDVLISHPQPGPPTMTAVDTVAEYATLYREHLQTMKARADA